MKKILLICLCVALYAAGFSQTRTPGTLNFSFTQSKGIKSHYYKVSSVPLVYKDSIIYSTSDVFVAWIVDSIGTFVETKIAYYGANTDDHLYNWYMNTRAAGLTQNKLDAITGPTRKVSPATNPLPFKTSTFVWDGKSIVDSIAGVGGGIAKDGLMHVLVEAAWISIADSAHMICDTFSFPKGPVASHLSITGDTTFNSIQIDWVPTAVLGVEAVKGYSQDIVVAPNPTTGIINVSFTSAKSIKVVNAEGVEVYNEAVIADGQSSKQIDLSGNANGLYFVLIDDGVLVNKLKVIVRK